MLDVEHNYVQQDTPWLLCPVPTCGSKIIGTWGVNSVKYNAEVEIKTHEVPLLSLQHGRWVAPMLLSLLLLLMLL